MIARGVSSGHALTDSTQLTLTFTPPIEGKALPFVAATYRILP